ncbi:TadE/TadG family type IV pilus assembly protein [Parvularcula dongshanensis]|uniref:TadE-like domain-containing protein n=1 Tax=Parvularcula dongshanensis TaxID=1173995 RepID=A0A840I590_9PROT|nr:TadE family protein [Parvularcula dongshanensis]MBB4660126.1 hypothetical protein [Parvularcula dongshanensis]
MRKRSFAARFSSFARRQDGVAASEAAFIVPLLVMALMSIFDLGFASTSRMQLDHALRTGTQLIMMNVHDEDAVEAATLATLEETQSGSMRNDGMCEPDKTCLTVVQTCRCGSAASSCTTLCSATSLPPSAFMTITALRRYEGIFLDDRPVGATITVQTR